jgi:hypothetical protein
MNESAPAVRRIGYKGEFVKDVAKQATGLADLAHSGPLKQIRHLVLRNANTPSRAVNPGQNRPARHGTVHDIVPGVRGSDILPPTWNSNEFDLDKEVGVEGLSVAMPPRLRPSSAMKRYAMFQMPGDPSRTASHGVRPSPSGLDRGKSRSEIAAHGLRVDDGSGPYQALMQASLERRGKEEEALALAELADAPGRSGMLTQSRGRLLSVVASGDGMPLGSAALFDPDPRPHLRGTAPTIGTGAPDMGVTGTSAANRRGVVDPILGLRRKGTGMIRGTVRVGYDCVREVTAETRKWCTVEGIDYGDVSIAIRFTLMPHYYDAFATSVHGITGGNFEIQSELQPPLFIADIGSMRAKLQAPSAAERESAMRQLARDQEAASRARTVLQDAAGAKGLKASDPQGSDGGAFSRFSADDVARHRLREAKRETQELANEQFRRLAGAGRLAALVRLYHRGLRVVFDSAPWHEKSSKAYVDKRVTQLEAADDDADRFGDAKSGLRDPDTGEMVRVYPAKDEPDETGTTPIMQAARHGWVDIVEELLRMGADSTRKNLRGETALSLAKAESNSASLALKLGAPGAVQRRKRAAKLVRALDGRSLLACAQQGDLRRVRYMIEDLGDNANETNTYGMTPLHFAVMNKDVEMTKLLIANGADVDAPNNIAQTPMALFNALPDRDRVTRALDRAIKEGAQLFGRLEERQKRAVSDEMSRMQQEQRLAKDLRQYTRGTTAARSVFSAFRKDAPVTEQEAKRRLHRSAATRRHKLEQAARVRNAFMRQQRKREAEARRTDPSVSADAVADSRRRGTRHDHAAAVKWMGTQLDAPANTPLGFSSVQQSSSALTVSWERHALNYFSQRAKAKLAKDAHTAIGPRRGTRKQGVSRSLQPQHTLGAQETSLEATSRLSNALSQGAHATAQLAEFAREQVATVEGVPPPDDPLFEKWMLMRFGPTK